MQNLVAVAGIKLINLASMGREISPWNDIRSVQELFSLIKKFKPDIVHTHTAKAGFVGRLAAMIAGVPAIVHTYHGHVLHGYFPAWKSALFRFLESFLAKRTNLLIAVSQKVAEELMEEGVAAVSRFEVVPLGLHLRPFLEVKPHGELKHEFRLSATTQLIGAVGRLVPIKDLLCLLYAMADLKQVLPELHLALVGDGECRSMLFAQAQRLGLDRQVHFTGWRRDLPYIYGGLDLVVLSSRNEGTPVSLIEALASGRPVIATQVGGVPEVLQGGRLGKLVSPGKPHEMGQAIRAELANKRELADALRLEVVERYSTEKLAEKMDKLYRRVLARRKNSGLMGTP